MSSGTSVERAERLTELLPGAGVDAMLVTNLLNLRYLTGFVGSNGLAVIGQDTRTFATDSRYTEHAAGQVDGSFERRELPREWPSAIGELLPAGELRLGFETSLPFRIHTRLIEALPDRVQLVPVDDLVERLRAVKEPEEIERMREATALADRALEQLLAGGLVGRTERDAAFALEVAIRNLGAERPSFEPIVAAGPHGALPHADPRAVEIERGQLVVIDWGAQLDGYCSDSTRTLATGELGAEAYEVYNLVLEAQLAGLAAARAGAGLRAVDAAAREIIESGGHGEHFRHGLGHGVGLDIHEDPRLSPSAEGKLEVGNTVTIEPGIYLPGVLGVRIEDLIAVTADGPDVLGSYPKELTVVG
jgi:Xaa-Pro aminopeptidase